MSLSAIDQNCRDTKEAVNQVQNMQINVVMHYIYKLICLMHEISHFGELFDISVSYKTGARICKYL